MKDICAINFNIEEFNSSFNRNISNQDWQQDNSYWYNQVKDREIVSPELSFLPPLQRRRLGDSARLIFSAAWPLTNKEENLPVIYASSQSENNRSFELFSDFLTQGTISPTSFSLSVHNAIVGQWTVMQNTTAESSAIATSKDNLEVALVEAYTMFQQGVTKVLIVLSETFLKEANYNSQPDLVFPPLDYALALVVTPGNNYSLKLQAQIQSPKVLVDNNLQFIKAHNLGLNHWTSPAQYGVWTWERKSN
ncbi:beta-ketoacyl synthase chain length factor [Psittacicella hinzii]|uniref:Beta-ketoacyl synthase-like N-terminal domain-containing protein n=1 Tax=Psittacicella hinzii TaxID=2028575 RepID=A0A3A1YQB5_9GAMM|nr:beta-ketoacyl synthase chain length factor [Psittacicella hinzii]RIY39721.1 hypothetical protein CKF58_01875 [Psittacicella hinzii]